MLSVIMSEEQLNVFTAMVDANLKAYGINALESTLKVLQVLQSAQKIEEQKENTDEQKT